MSGIPFPKDNEYLAGHEKAEKSFLDNYNRGTLASSWLICGPKGIGKATFAYRAARFLLADYETTLEEKEGRLEVPLNNPVFKKISSKSHPCLKIIERGYNKEEQKRIEKEIASGKWGGDSRQEDADRKKSSFITVDDVRSINKFFSYSSSDGNWRIVIVDSADDMNKNSANAILKILEEPPEKAMLFIVANNPDRLLPTIKSRCSRINFAPLDKEVVLSLISRYMPDAEETDILLTVADGSIGKAINFKENNGIELFYKMLEVFSLMPQTDVVNIYSFAEMAIKNDNTYSIATELITDWIARMVKYGARNGEFNEAIAGEAEIFASFLNSHRIDYWIEIRQKIIDMFARTNIVNMDKKQAVINAFTLLGQ